jgi:hypothetical protein
LLKTKDELASFRNFVLGSSWGPSGRAGGGMIFGFQNQHDPDEPSPVAKLICDPIPAQ